MQITLSLEVLVAGAVIAQGVFAGLVLWFAPRNRFSNRILTMLSNCLTGLSLTDMETGYKLFRREVIDQLAPGLEH